MSARSALSADKLLVVSFSIAITSGILAISAMLLAAIAFSNGTMISIPFLATFDGFRETASAPSVTISGSWVAAAVVAAMLALPLCVIALRMNRKQTE